jgi:hypothetical protein
MKIITIIVSLLWPVFRLIKNRANPLNLRHLRAILKYD